jgi:putative acetyltransferase
MVHWNFKAMMITTIRSATEADADAIAEAHVDSIRTLGPAAYASEVVDVWGAARSGERYVRSMHQGETFFVAVPSSEDGNVLGFSSHRIENGQHRAVIYVRAAAARQGIGSRLLRCSLDTAKLLGASEVRVDASLIAVPFYLRNGFVELGTGSHRLKNGPEMACVYMKKSLVG